MTKVLVTGAGGFIGHHLVTFLKQQGYWVRGVDQKTRSMRRPMPMSSCLLDLRRWENCLTATREVDEVYALAADMGGMGFISAHHAEILHNNSLINIHTLDAARENSRQAIFVLVLGMRVSRIQADQRRRGSPERGGCLSGAAAGRLRMGEAGDRAAMYPLSRGLRHPDPHRAVSQYFRSAGYLGGRTRESARGDVSQDRYRQADQERGNRDLG